MLISTRKQFLQTDAGASAKLELLRMLKSPAYDTHVSYDATVERNLTFIDRHLNYLVKHPYINPLVYLSNLRVMTKIKH